VSKLKGWRLGKAFDHGGSRYEIVVADDPASFPKITVKALKNGKDCLVGLPGGIPARVCYEVTFDTAESFEDFFGTPAVQYFIDDLADKIRRFG